LFTLAIPSYYFPTFQRSTEYEPMSVSHVTSPVVYAVEISNEEVTILGGAERFVYRTPYHHAKVTPTT
jgi:hypothetical protein